jgi:protein-tyrosine phosphatase
MSSQVLFLCTGNYYRSRFAEELFNHLARERGVEAAAISRGLRIDRTGMNQGPVSVHTRERLRSMGIDGRGLERMPMDLTYGDLQKSHVVVAVKEAEHRAMLEEKFPGWSGRVVFWNIHDLDAATPDAALAEIEQAVRGLVEGVGKLGRR